MLIQEQSDEDQGSLCLFHDENLNMYFRNNKQTTFQDWQDMGKVTADLITSHYALVLQIKRLYSIRIRAWQFTGKGHGA